MPVSSTGTSYKIIRNACNPALGPGYKLLAVFATLAAFSTATAISAAIIYNDYDGLIDHDDIPRDNDRAVEPEAEGYKNDAVGLYIALNINVVA